MKKKIVTDYFSLSKKWPRRVPKIKKITLKTVNYMSQYFNKNYIYNLNLILSEQVGIKKLNKKYKNKYKDTDVLTFVTDFRHKDLGNIFYCDIFFSIDTIIRHINENKINLYDHFNHLLIHSILHINGYDHKNESQFIKMKNIEIKTLKKLGIKNPYIN